MSAENRSHVQDQATIINRLFHEATPQNGRRESENRPVFAEGNSDDLGLDHPTAESAEGRVLIIGCSTFFGNNKPPGSRLIPVGKEYNRTDKTKTAGLNCPNQVV